MSRLQGKNTFNNTRSNAAPPEIGGSITARPKHPSTVELEVNNIKITLWS